MSCLKLRFPPRFNRSFLHSDIQCSWRKKSFLHQYCLIHMILLPSLETYANWAGGQPREGINRRSILLDKIEKFLQKNQRLVTTICNLWRQVVLKITHPAQGTVDFILDNLEIFYFIVDLQILILQTILHLTAIQLLREQ